MNNYKNILLTLLMFLACLSGVAQQKMVQLKGKVIDPYTNAPIEGAIVGATGLATAVTTNEKGEFQFEIPTLKGTINAWALGYYTADMPIMGRENIEMVLVPEDKFGYSKDMQVPLHGTVDARTNISSASYVSKKDISDNKLTVEQILNTIPGLLVRDKSGMPGEGSYVNMRGLNTFNAKSAPLIVLNGMPLVADINESPVVTGYSRSLLNGVNPRDIQNITVLRASEAAIYGSMGSNGVIMIETDKASDLETKVEFIGQYGVNFRQQEMPLMNISQYKDYVSSVARTAYSTTADIYNRFPYLIDNPNDPNWQYNTYLYNNNTNWQDIIYKPGFITDNVLKVKGGDAIAKFDISAGYSGNAGQVDNTTYNKYYIRLNSDVNISRKVTFATTFSSSFINSNLMEQGMVKETNPLLAALRKAEIFSPYEKSAENDIRPSFSTVGHVNNSISNPLAIVSDVEAKSKVYDINANATLKYKINDNFEVSGIAGLFYNLNRESLFVPGRSAKTIMGLQNNVAENTVRAGIAQTFNVYYSANASFNKVYNDLHAVKASVGAQVFMNNEEYDAGEGINTATDFYKTLDQVTASKRFFGYNNTWNWMNFNAKAQYIYNHLVGVGVTVASDRSSAIGSDANLFQFYPSVNGAVYLKNTPFLANVSLINQLTVRADYTTLGNSQFATALSKYYYNSNKYTEISGINRAGVPNKKLGAEITRTFSLGVDYSMWNNRIDISAEYYRAKSKDLIMLRPVSPVFGSSYMYDNIGSVLNQGFEARFQVAAIFTKNTKWYIGATIARNKNKILSLGGVDQLVTEFSDGSALVNKVGQPMNAFYGLYSDGVYSRTSEAQSSNVKNFNGLPFAGGDVIFSDRNGDKVINNNDRTALGVADPTIFGTIFTNFQHKSLQVSAVFGYSWRGRAYNATRRMLESSSDYGNQYKSVASRWIMEGQQTDMPRAAFGDPMQNSRFSNRHIEDNSYLKLKELMISYKFPVMNGITVFAAGENLFTITNYLGIDPEFSYSYSSTMQGFDYAKIALARTIKFGVKLQF